jgi:hypothetical protein
MMKLLEIEHQVLDLLESHLASLLASTCSQYRELACRHGHELVIYCSASRRWKRKQKKRRQEEGETGSDAARTTGYLVRRGDIKSTT